MGKLTLAFALAAMTLATGCANNARADYLEPETENAFLKNLGRASVVLSPLSMGARVLVAEISRDIEENGPMARRQKAAAGGKILKKDDAGEPYYFVERPAEPAPASAENAATTVAEEEKGPATPTMVASKQTYFIVDDGKEYPLNANR
ncbi:MAG: hypothetical protein J6333_08380 [Planctomycetes bacterium]|nr:hypothetical protein [Planctomycetota bacterium]